MTQGTVTLKLVGARTYVGPRTKDKLLKKGDTFAFSAVDAEAVLKLSNTDRLNNVHPYFVVVPGQRQARAPEPVVEEVEVEAQGEGDPLEGEEGTDEAPVEKAQPKPKAARVSRKKAVAGE